MPNGFDYFVVICKEDDGQYVLATRTVWEFRSHAKAYADTVAKSREPLVVSGKFDELRFDGLGRALKLNLDKLEK